MSGGSYNYLCAKNADTIINSQDSLWDMANRLRGLGYANDAARETEEVIRLVREYERVVEEKIRKLASVWQAVEWWKSGDWGESRLHEALERYRDR